MAYKQCTKCRGRQKVYVINGTAVSFTDMGGEKLDCPSCKGTGFEEVKVKTKRKKVVKE